MNKIAVTLLLLWFCAAGPAQTTAEDHITPTVRLYHPKYMESRQRMDAVADFVNSLLKNAKVRWEAAPRCLVIRGETPTDVDAAEALLNRFDVDGAQATYPLQPLHIDIAAYLILATSGPTPEVVLLHGQEAPTPLRSVPPEAQSAVDEMKRAFSYEHYYLADEVIVTEPHGEGEISGVLPWTAYISPNTSYSLSYKFPIVNEDRSLGLGGFQFVLNPGGGVPESKIRTDAVIHENQKLVLGKLRLNFRDQADLFVVLTSRLHN